MYVIGKILRLNYCVLRLFEKKRNVKNLEKLKKAYVQNLQIGISLLKWKKSFYICLIDLVE